MRHVPQGEGRAGRRRGAAHRLSVQPGQALPEGHLALSPEPPSRPPAARLLPRRGRSGRISRHRLRRGDRACRDRDRAHPARPRSRRDGRPQRSEPHHREDLPHGEVRPRLLEDAPHRLQRPALHGERRGREQEGVRHRSRGESHGRRDRRRGGVDQRRQRRRMRADHHRLRLAGPRARGAHHRGRSSHHADRAHVRPLPADPAGARRRALQRRASPDDRARLARPRLHPRPHAGVRGGRRARPRVDARPHGARHRHRRARHPSVRGMVGHRPHQLPHARAGHRALEPRGAERPRGHQPGAGVGTDRTARLRLRHHHGPGQRAGWPRARAEVRSASGRARHREPGASRARRLRLGRRPGHAAACRRGRLRDVPQDRRRRDPRSPHRELQPARVIARQRLRARRSSSASSSTSPSTSS